MDRPSTSSVKAEPSATMDQNQKLNDTTSCKIPRDNLPPILEEPRRQIVRVWNLPAVREVRDLPI